MINLLATMGFGTNSVPSSVILDGFVVNPVEPATFSGCAFTIDNHRDAMSANSMASMQSNNISSMESDLCR